MHNINIWLLELRVVIERTTLIEVGDVNVVPLVLPAVPLGLDVVSEDSTLGEGVITFLDQIWVRCLEWGKDCVCLGKCIRCFLLKDNFGSV